MAPPVEPVPSDESIPRRADVVIVGGGIIGASTALRLAERGISTVLCEKGRIAGEQSSRNWGWVRTMGRDPREIALSIESQRLWRDLNTRVEEDTGFRQAGIVYFCETAKDIEKYEAWLEHARPFQLDTRLIGPDEVEKVAPGSSRRWAGALYTPSDGRAEPQRAAPAIAAAARRRGAIILAPCAVRGIETSAGRVSAAITEKGRIDCNAVVLAGGAWSRLFCGNLGLELPQLKLLGSVMRTQPIAGAPEATAGGSNFAFRKRLDGGYTVAQRNATIAEIVPDTFRLFFDFLPALRIQWSELRLRIGRRFLEEWRMPRRWPLDGASPFEAVRVLDPAPNDAVLDEGQANLVRLFPAFQNMVVAERWAGLIDATPDAIPVISPIETLPGFFIATGFSGHGFGIGPAAGRLMADLVAGDSPIVDPAAFRYSRFTDGSWRKAV
jgi:glycine/D-amino acid oxidase-like deaminating enzyme